MDAFKLISDNYCGPCVYTPICAATRLDHNGRNKNIMKL